ncbi:hypothetical protein DFH06DRAFT_60114 [Mycena polygramma]|nr:hypothetical protein DFH06DRAFT_1310223 [Mycena polygramma]KAJ7673270.1 hypothetical protein DFH06DRAFT_60114 [Mycena polygramma]
MLYDPLSIPSSHCPLKSLQRSFCSISMAQKLEDLIIRASKLGRPRVVPYLWPVYVVHSAILRLPCWSNFDILTSPNAIPTTEKLLECWLPRAGHHPLDVSLRAQDSLYATLAPHFHQIRSLQCSVDSASTFPSQLFKGRVPLLTTLALSFNDTTDGLPTPIDAFADCYQLQKVVLSYFTFPWVALPWGQLTHLDLLEQTVAECVEILHHTPLLETLVVELVPSDEVPQAPVRLEYVHTLKFPEYEANTDILEHVTLPALTHLQLELSRFDIPPPDVTTETQFVSFVARSACTLRSITLFSPNITSTLTCLRAAPTLASVCLRDVPWAVYEFKHFFNALRNGGFLPNLGSLSLNPCVHAVEIRYDDLAALLAPRRRGGDTGNGNVRLESFELVLAAAPEPGFQPTVVELEQGLDALQAMEAEGLKLNIRNLQKLTSSTDGVAVYVPFNHTV